MNENWAQQLALLPELLGQHVLLCGMALLGGVSISLPLGLFIAHRQTMRTLVLTAAGIVQTIPGLALLAAMVTLLGAFGFWPALAALFLYSILPTLRNTVTGIVEIDSALVESAKAAGMTPRQILLQVELPLATPVIVAGIRTAAVWVIGVATLSTPVGQPSLGNFIFSGLQTRNSVAVAVGCVAAAVLALLVDGLLAMLQRGLTTGSKRHKLLAGLGLLAVISLGGLSTLLEAAPTASVSRAPVAIGPTGGSSEPPKTRVAPLRIGAKTFTEQYILAALLQQRLSAAGYRTKKVESLGSSVIFDALAQGHIDLYVDYTGTLWANAMKRKNVASRWRVQTATAQWLAEEHGIRQLGGLGFENAYALALRAQDAQRLALTSLQQLAAYAPQWSIGGDYEFFQRPEWQRLTETYDLRFGVQKSFDSTFMYPALRDGTVNVISAFSSDGRIAAYDLVLLDDPLQAFPPYDAVLLLGPSVAQDMGVVRALQPLLGHITVDLMRQASLRVDREASAQTPTETPAAAARWLDESLRDRDSTP